jgi:hypothetical protein
MRSAASESGPGIPSPEQAPPVPADVPDPDPTDNRAACRAFPAPSQRLR